MNYRKLMPVILMASFFSCKNQDHQTNEIFKNSKEVSCKIFPIDFMLGKPYQIKLINNTLIIADNSDDNSILLYDCKNNKLLGTILKRGQGPNEVLTPLSLEASSKDNLVSVFQRQSGRHTEYQLNELLSGNVIPTKTLQFDNTDRIVKSKSGYISEGEYEKGSIN